MYRGRGGGGRYSHGAGRGRGGSSTSRTTLKGLFADGIWQCDCTPRLPAEHFKVKKEGKNQGRWFYTCQNAEPKRCGFFLWDEDAKPREEAAVLSNSRTEPMGRQSVGGEVQEGWDAGRAARAARTDAMGARGAIRGRGLFAGVPDAHNASRHVTDGDDERMPSPSPKQRSPPPPYTAMPSSSAGKRNAQQAGMDDEDDEFFPWPLTGQEEQDLANVADTAQTPKTPHKSLKTGVYATPATTVTKRRLPWLDPEETPKATATALPSSSRVDSEAPETPSRSTGITAAPTTVQLAAPTPQPPPTRTNMTTPSPPARFKDALSNPADSSSSLTSEALETLEDIDIPPDIRDKLRSVLSKHDLKTQGVTKGREIARLAVKAKEAKIAEFETRIAGLENAKIAELQARIGSLEAEREVDRSVIRQLKWQLEHGEKEADSQETIA